MSKAAQHAATLLDLLTEYVEVQDEWEEHLTAAQNKDYASLDEEKDEHRRIQSEFMLPLMERCAEAGFAYSDLLLIIPGPFVTSFDDRAEMLEDFEQWVKETYDG